MKMPTGQDIINAIEEHGLREVELDGSYIDDVEFIAFLLSETEGSDNSTIYRVAFLHLKTLEVELREEIYKDW